MILGCPNHSNAIALHLSGHAKDSDSGPVLGPDLVKMIEQLV